MPPPLTPRIGYLHFNLENYPGVVAHTLIIPVELSERSARDVCAFVNRRRDYGLQLGECWLSNVAGGEPVSVVENLSYAPTPVGDDFYSAAHHLDLDSLLRDAAAPRNKN